jgi:hypothetical protein
VDTVTKVKFDERGNYVPMSDQEAYSTGKKWMIVGGIIAVLLPFAVWGLSVAFSGPAGRGKQIRQINDANNRTFAQEEFPQLYQDIKAYDQQISVQQAALDAHKAQDGEHDRLAQVVAGIKSQCISTTQQYNAEAQKISKRQFIEHGLPDQIDSMDPATDCK